MAGQDAVNILWSSFRQLPHRVNPCKLLAYKLALPGCLYPFDAYYLANSESVERREFVADDELQYVSPFAAEGVAMPELSNQH